MAKTHTEEQISRLSCPDRNSRIDALRQLSACGSNHEHIPISSRKDVNNHIHTAYSFSPYSPAMAVWLAEKAGLATAGIMDHDTVAGAYEFMEASNITGLPVTVGAECRVSFSRTVLNGRHINNPDQKTLAYIAMHGIPHNRLDAVNDFFMPVRAARNERNRRMTCVLNDILYKTGITLEYEKDVLPLSLYQYGGSVTERHILFALAQHIITKTGIGEGLVRFLTQVLQISIGDKACAWLADIDNEYAAYDLLGVLKSGLVEQFYIDANGEECPDVLRTAGFAHANGIILAYAYLGDVTESVTGDKKAQLFEDGYIGELFGTLYELGFNAVTYMPSRNTREQLARVRKLCEKYGFLQISGEDINQPRQQFICTVMRDPMYSNLYDSAWALIGHEMMATESVDSSIFSEQARRLRPDLNARTEYYRDIALAEYIKGKI